MDFGSVDSANWRGPTGRDLDRNRSRSHRTRRVSFDNGHGLPFPERGTGIGDAFCARFHLALDINRRYVFRSHHSVITRITTGLRRGLIESVLINDELIIARRLACRSVTVLRPVISPRFLAPRVALWESSSVRDTRFRSRTSSKDAELVRLETDVANFPRNHANRR